MTLNDRLEQWKKTPLTENHEIDVSLFKKIVEKAKRDETTIMEKKEVKLKG